MVEHVLERSLWKWAVKQVDHYLNDESDPNKKRDLERDRFMLIFLYYTGLRRHELAKSTMDKLRFKDGGWELRVRGKGRTTVENVILVKGAVAALSRYRLARDMPALPGPDEKGIPLLAANRGKKSITDNYMNTLLKKLFARLADDAAAINPSWPEKLKNATAHWLRHTIATHNAESGVPLHVTADQLRHRSIDTTRNIYTHAGKSQKNRASLELVDTEARDED